MSSFSITCSVYHFALWEMETCMVTKHASTEMRKHLVHEGLSEIIAHPQLLFILDLIKQLNRQAPTGVLITKSSPPSAAEPHTIPGVHDQRPQPRPDQRLQNPTGINPSSSHERNNVM